jgi:hypothetical protein
VTVARFITRPNTGASAVLADPVLERIVVTDTVPPFRILREIVASKLTILDSTAAIASAIVGAHHIRRAAALVEDRLAVPRLKRGAEMDPYWKSRETRTRERLDAFPGLDAFEEVDLGSVAGKHL